MQARYSHSCWENPSHYLSCYSICLKCQGGFFFLFFCTRVYQVKFMHLDPGTMWRKVIVLGKMLSNKPIRLQNGFPLSRGTGLYSRGKRDRISQRVRTCWSFFILVLYERRVQSPGIPPSRVNAWTRNAFSAPDSYCRTKWFYRPQTQLPPTCKSLGLGPSSQMKAALPFGSSGVVFLPGFIM